MSYRFDHVRVRVRDPALSARDYAAVFGGCEVVEDGGDEVWLSAGGDVGIRFVRELEEQGAGDAPRIEALAFADSRPDAAHRSVAVTRGLEVDLVEGRSFDAQPPRPGRPYFHHVSCLVERLDEADGQFRRELGLRSIFDFSKEGDGGFRLLADDDWREAGHDFTLEPIGGPNFGPEQPWWDAHGSHFDHICFICGDVEAIYRRGVDGGMHAMLPPASYPEFDDLQIGWLYDRDGVHIELMSPLAEDSLRLAFETGDVENTWVDDQTAEPAWLPRPEPTDD
jgi:catechol 2,3-dioxygenase-like lactoylglutathione lyase family enzyme